MKNNQFESGDLVPADFILIQNYVQVHFPGTDPLVFLSDELSKLILTPIRNATIAGQLNPLIQQQKAALLAGTATVADMQTALNPILNKP